MEYQYQQQDIEELLSSKAIRERSQKILDLCLKEEGQFRVHQERLNDLAEFVIEVIKGKYPDLKIPYHSRWSHFQVGHVDRLSQLMTALKGASKEEVARVKFELVITSVLLDAGAGMSWRYQEEGTGAIFGRSEGLAVASFKMFMKGAFSSDLSEPLRADGPGLIHVVEKDILDAFQVSVGNPLKGTAGRTELIHQLGKAVENQPEYFGENLRRPGHLVDYFLAKAENGRLPARVILETLLRSLGSIWPGRIQFGEVNLGDVWHHPKLGAEGDPSSLVPFHKLSQWLTYSLIEPLEELGLEVYGLDELTGLAEYRNGGLFMDFGIIEPLDERVREESHHSSSALIIEWRALTICLLDQVAELVREKLGLNGENFPLAKVLEGGTWWAGRKIAQQKRDDGRPPLDIISDGTVF